jgi:peptidoglycan pentaglycine glycine transferase (the first glycine)
MASFSYDIDMKIQICKNKNEWEEGLLANEQTSFLQSWDWGEFQRSVGNQPIRIQMLEESGVVFQLQGFEHKLGLGLKYLYVPRLQTTDFRLQSLTSYIKKRGIAFLRIEPNDSGVNFSEIRSPKIEVRNRQPQHTLILDLSKQEESLLDEMHNKTRYNIRLAERKGLEVKENKDADIFWKLNKETFNRDGFKSHKKDYYNKMLVSEISHQLTAYYNKEPIATNILVKFGSTMVYLHGASSNKHRNLMAPYLLQWEGVKLAKMLGCKFYDFWGVAPLTHTHGASNLGDNLKILTPNSPTTTFNEYSWNIKHKWTGMTRFKVGFGGDVTEYGQAVDIILSPFKYKLYNLAKKYYE